MNVLALFAASFMLGAASAAHTPGNWTQVAGGAWVPDGSVMNKVSTGLQAYAEAMAKRQGRAMRPWSEYSFQYQGRVSRGKRYIYILGLCATVGDEDLSASFYEVLDGSSCYFGLTFDPKRQRFEDFRINAVR
jgi:hypothetical protein